jgi:aspartate aminotransferase
MALFGHVPVAPIDPILGTTQLYNADKDARKINLGVGAYRTEQGKPYVLEVVKEAEQDMLRDLGGSIDKEYSTIDGPGELKKLTQALAFGADSPAVGEGRVASVQALSGTGALRVLSEFVKTHLPAEAHEVWCSDPTWGNHTAIFKSAGLAVKTYPYWNAKTMGLDFEGMMAALRGAAAGSMVLLHACAHNPTGIDPSEAQWREIAALMKERRLIPLIDSAYQGYASGDLDKDAWALRYFERMGFEMFLCQSFAKNLGLYGERIGMLHVVCGKADHATAVLSQVKLVVRAMYSSPPRHGAHLVVKILGDQGRFKRWQQELKAMADRINEARGLLRGGLERKGTPGTWRHVTDQIGMFSFTGLTKPQCERLIKEHHIYLLSSGRISMAGLNKSNIDYMVDSVDEVVRHSPASRL